MQIGWQIDEQGKDRMIRVRMIGRDSLLGGMGGEFGRMIKGNRDMHFTQVAPTCGIFPGRASHGTVRSSSRQS